LDVRSSVQNRNALFMRISGIAPPPMRTAFFETPRQRAIVHRITAEDFFCKAPV